MFCKKCGAGLSEEGVFCEFCGERKEATNLGATVVEKANKLTNSAIKRTGNKLNGMHNIKKVCIGVAGVLVVALLFGRFFSDKARIEGTWETILYGEKYTIKLEKGIVYSDEISGYFEEVGDYKVRDGHIMFTTTAGEMVGLAEYELKGDVLKMNDPEEGWQTFRRIKNHERQTASAQGIQNSKEEQYEEGFSKENVYKLTYEIEANLAINIIEDTIDKIKQRSKYYCDEKIRKIDVYQEGEHNIIIEIYSEAGQIAILPAEAGLINKGELVFESMEGETVISNEDIEKAVGKEVGGDMGGEYVVSLQLTKVGTEKVAKATQDNLGKQISIRYNGNVISSPTVQSVITGGQLQVTGMSLIEEAEEMAMILNTGVLLTEPELVDSEVIEN